ncbi:MAG: conjugal transfer protein TraF [Nitrospiraceae bacterium]
MKRTARVTWMLASGLFLVTVVFAPTQITAVEFAIVGPRAVGMGGAGVAVTTDALATYWNPAGLAMQKSADIRVQGSVQAVDRGGVKDTLDAINNIDLTNPANLATLQGLLNTLNSGTVSGVAAAGLYWKGSFGDQAFGFNISDVATGGEFAPTPLTANCNPSPCVAGSSLIVNGQLSVQGLEARQAGFSYAYAFSDRTFAIGATAKIIQGAAYNASVSVFQSDGDISFREDLGKPEISTAISIDAGAIYRPSSWLRFGVVGKDLTQPTFDAPGGQEFKLVPQVRGGVAINPYDSLTIAFDGDITSNKTLVPGIKSRVLSLGAEQTLPAEFLSLRVGALKNVEDAKSIITPTAGFGFRFFALRMDFGGGYDFQEGQALASGSLSMTF